MFTWARNGHILRGTGSDGCYSTFKLGGIGSDLFAVAAFFDRRWNGVSPNLNEPTQAWLLKEAAVSLHALGRLTETLKPMRVSLKQCVAQNELKAPAISASNLSELEVTQGRLDSAVATLAAESTSPTTAATQSERCRFA